MELQRQYQAACEAGDFAAEIRVLQSITHDHPDVGWGWFDLGLRMKWTRDWAASREANARALALLDTTAERPEAWNLGIAATALGDWATARRAWSAYGIGLPDGADDQPIDGDFGLTPVRLNPDPRFGEPAFTLDGERFRTEVVWSRRLCPARARIENVPLPESGHRWGDIVLHDGDPVGHRRLGASERPVFNELALLARGPYATLTTVIDAADRVHLDEMQDAFADRGWAVESWTTSTQFLCKACSEGLPDEAHDHAVRRPGETVALGIAAPPDAVEPVLDAWLREQGLERGPIVPASA
ncbi:MAG: tetratricopeptide repeat protein [Jatrophihabitans sp.]|uniref:tetratricopeptide repeat protein n=1 Tax=Jatrophihabitans sp. TaxID=1932789 RepID=UPI003F813E30